MKVHGVTFIVSAITGGGVSTTSDASAFTREYTCEGGTVNGEKHCEVFVDSDQSSVSSVVAYVAAGTGVAPCSMWMDRIGMSCGSWTSAGSTGPVSVDLTGAWDCGGLPCGSRSYPFLYVYGSIYGYQVTN